MRHLFSIAVALMLLVEALMPGMDRCELIKFSNLFNHYQEIGDHTSVLSFLVSHYGDTPAKGHQGDSHDENLPFQERPCCHGVVFFPEQTGFPIITSEPTVQKKDPFYIAPVASEYRAPVFQPPKA